MNNHLFEQKIKKEWETIPTPSFSTYQKIITDVTNATLHRNKNEGIYNIQPSYYFTMKKYLIGTGTVIAIIALIVIIPKIYTQSITPESVMTTEPQMYGINLPASDSNSVIDQIVREVLIEASLDAENALSDVSIDDPDDIVLFQDLANSLII